jgi:hypothetical protein
MRAIRPRGVPRPLCGRVLCLGNEGQRESLAAPDVEQRAARAGQLGGQRRGVHRITRQLAARELPGRDARVEEPIAGAAHQQLEERVARRPASRVCHETADQSHDHSDDQAADQEVAAELPDAAGPEHLPGQRVQAALPQQRTGLDFGIEQRRDDEGIDDVGGQVHLQAIQAQ